MSFVLTEEQRAIKKTARDLAQSRLSTRALRALRDARDAVGLSREAWSELASLGLAGVTLPEAHGGAGLGFAELGVVLEELGRSLAATPYLSTVVLGAGALVLGASESQRALHLPAICAGERLLALAHEEGTRHAPYAVATSAGRTGGGFAITGEKAMVLDGHIADALVVVARTGGAPGEAGGLTLFLVPRETEGLSVQRTMMVDSRNAARVRLDRVNVPEAAVIGGVDRGAEILTPLLDRAAIALSAEMLGGALEAFERTVAYLKVRRQFGVAVGSFQALKHRAASMFCELELLRSIVMDALRAVDEGREGLSVTASAAKARASDVFVHVANEAIQMHGGVGVTDELDIGLFLKRARAAEMTLGTAAYHRDRFGRLQGY